MSARGPRAALMAVGAKSVGRMRTASRARYAKRGHVPGRVSQANEAMARLQAPISASCSLDPQASSGG